MKITLSVVAATLAATASAAFDKDLPWGKRDYPCINVFQGISENSTVVAGAAIELKFNRHTTTRCSDALTAYAGSDYQVWLYNAPNRDGGDVAWAAQAKVADGIKEADGKATITIPTDLPAVADSTNWYLRVSTNLDSAPQMPTEFHAAGPFTIATS